MLHAPIGKPVVTSASGGGEEDDDLRVLFQTVAPSLAFLFSLSLHITSSSPSFFYSFDIISRFIIIPSIIMLDFLLITIFNPDCFGISEEKVQTESAKSG